MGKGNGVTRRQFLATSGAAVAAGSLGLGLFVPRFPRASERIRVGLVGCGKRGLGAAVNAAKADPGVQLTAIADVFPDALDNARRLLQAELKHQFAVTPETSFSGFDAYRKLISADVDVVLLATPPHFRPDQMQAAVNAGKHVFVEKPMAVDVPGIKKVFAATEEARRRGLNVVSGLCYRYVTPKRELMKRIHDGRIGEIRSIHCVYNKPNWALIPKKPLWSEMEHQIRNFNHYLWLQGDIAVDLLVHNLDKASWALNGEMPVRVSGVGGKQSSSVGGSFDHHGLVYEYASGARLHAYTRCITGADLETTDIVYGTRGTANIMAANIQGECPWQYEGGWNDMYQTQMDEMMAAIRADRPINDGEFMAKSTFLGIMGRWASYTGKSLTWDQVWNSAQVLGPSSYELGSAPQETPAIPGKTKLT